MIKLILFGILKGIGILLLVLLLLLLLMVLVVLLSPIRYHPVSYTHLILLMAS